MQRNTVVLFTANNARVLINPENVSIYEHMPNALINPHFDWVQGLPPHFWKKVGNEIRPKSEHERKATLEHMKDNGPHNVIPYPVVTEKIVEREVPKIIYQDRVVEVMSLYAKVYIAIASAAAAGLIALHFIK